MESINFIKNIDGLGRIVIPMDIRRKLDINTGDSLSISIVDNNIMLTKYSSLDNNGKIIDVIKSFIDEFDIKVIYMNKEVVIYSNIVNSGIKLNRDVRDLVINGNNFREFNTEYLFGEVKLKGVYNMLPIVSNEGIVGSIIVFSNDKGYDFCKLLNKIITLELNISWYKNYFVLN